ncbi:MAG: FAD-dependent oxidoreductase [Cyanobacteria bacterium J06598_3]
MPSKIIVVGCGIVGAFIAYELSRQTSASIVVVDRGGPAEGSTGAALGVLMGVISGRVKGRTWRLREASIRRYPTLINELFQAGYSVPFNNQGIVSLCYDEAKLPRWETLQAKRAAQGWPLEIWRPQHLLERCPQVSLINHTNADEYRHVKAAIYSPMDGQVHPAELTKALVAAAGDRGVIFHFNTEVTQLNMECDRCTSIQTTAGETTTGLTTTELAADWVILSAGLGSAALTQLKTSAQHEPLELMPVLGQAMKLQLPENLGGPSFQPVINGNDIQCVPLGKGRYWIGATVEFPPETAPLGIAAEAEANGLANLQKGAADFIPDMAQATILKTWSGLRPRPVGQPAPVIKPLGNTTNITLATAHYRNGVLLAPATAQQVCEQLKALS